METLGRIGRGAALVLGFLFIGVVAPLVAFLGTVFANSEGEVWAALLVYATIPLGIGLAILFGALRRSANVRIAVGVLLAGVLAPLGAVLSFAPVGSDLGSNFMEPPTWTYPLHDAFRTLIPATVVPAALGVVFILSGARPHRGWRARLAASAAVVVTGVGVVVVSLAAGYGNGGGGRCVVVQMQPPACVSYPRMVEAEYLATDPLHPQTVYVAESGSTYKSTDGGANWYLFNGRTPESPSDTFDPYYPQWHGRHIDVPGYSYVSGVAYSRHAIFVTGRDGVYEKANAGTVWRLVVHDREIGPIAVSANGRVLYAGYRPAGFGHGGEARVYRFRLPK